MNSKNIYEIDLDQNRANFAHLTPLSFIERCSSVYPRKVSLIHGDKEYTWAETYKRCCLLASALLKMGIGKGDTVAFMGANTPETFEGHFGVPMTGAVLNALNVRLDAKAIAFILEHAEAKVLFTDREYSDTIKAVLELVPQELTVIDIDDPSFSGGELLGSEDYEAFLKKGDDDYSCFQIEDEWQAISLNYTSGTTGDPKGVVFHHRGAYLNAISNNLCWDMTAHPIYLWTLPMFHCNGWCFPWTIAAVNGTHVCLREVRGDAIWAALADHRVTHLCGAPVVMSTLLAASQQQQRRLTTTVEFFTAAAPPPESVLSEMREAGFNVTHLYGLTEVYGPAVANDWHAEWDALPAAQQATLKARQGVRYHALEQLEVMDPATMVAVPRDGATLGEVMFRGNVVMKGYLKNKAATDEAFAGGWFHSGDLAVVHPDGYVQLKDRSKDIIISGGENISSIEIEEALRKHPQVAAAAAVAMPHPKWGETPCAFVELHAGAAVSADQLIAWCRQHLAAYKAPSRIVFGDIIKTSTGKVQKFALRQRAAQLTE